MTAAKLSIRAGDGTELWSGTDEDLTRLADRVGRRGNSKIEGVPMKDTDADREVKDRAFRVTADELRGFVERCERLDEEKAQIADQRAAVIAEAKARGYDTKALRRLIALRKRDADQVAEEEAVLELYRQALGM